MTTDEQQIRDMSAAWSAATKRGDIDTVLTYMAEDVVFLVAGQPPMLGRAAFAAAAKAQALNAPSSAQRPTIDSRQTIEEITVLGDWAYMRTHLQVTITPPGGAPFARAGHTLSILRKIDGRWVIARDANMLSPVRLPGSEGA